MGEIVYFLILGFIPFMVGTGREAFWFPLAAGTIGGLVMSLIGVFVLLPVLALKKDVLQPKFGNKVGSC